MLIGQKPIQFELDYFDSNINDPIRTNRYYSLVERIMTIKGGQVLVSA